MKLNGNIKHSIAEWPFKHMGERWSIKKTCQVAKRLHVESVELVAPSDFPVLVKHHLTCAIALPDPIVLGDPPFLRGFNYKTNHDLLLAKVGENMKACKKFGVPSTLVFTGYKWVNPHNPKSRVISIERGIHDCVLGLKKLAKVAKRYKVVACLEHLNSRDGTHPMRGHPGYWGDNIDVLAEIIRRVNSPWVKLLFDVYHVQIMHGDVIRRLCRYAHILGHVHTAGCPGRGELDGTQEINYPPVMRALVANRYEGYVGHEFIPTEGSNPVKGLRQAIQVCDV